MVNTKTEERAADSVNVLKWLYLVIQGMMKNHS